MELRYDGPGHVLEAFGQTVKRGESDVFDKAEARLLLADERIRVTEIPPEQKRAGTAGNEPAEPEAHKGVGRQTNSNQEE